MNWVLLSERLIYHGLVCLLFKGLWPLKGGLILLAVLTAWRDSLRESREIDQKVLLQQMGLLLDRMQSGNSPAWSYQTMGRFPLPAYFLHPEEEHFNVSIFKRQLELFEKRILLQEELKSDFAIIRYRVQLMKYLPLGMMLFLKSFVLQDSLLAAELLVAAGLLGSYYFAEEQREL